MPVAPLPSGTAPFSDEGGTRWPTDTTQPSASPVELLLGSTQNSKLRAVTRQVDASVPGCYGRRLVQDRTGGHKS